MESRIQDCLVERGEVFTSRCHGYKISGPQQTANMAKKKEKIDMYDFPVHDCTREEKVALFFNRSTMQMAVLQLVLVKKDC